MSYAVETVEVKDAFRVVLREGRGDEVLGDFMGGFLSYRPSVFATCSSRI